MNDQIKQIPPSLSTDDNMDSISIKSPYTDGSILAMAYGNISMSSGSSDSEYRFQRLERGLKTIRRGRIVVAVPNFKSQNIISQTSGNNPFKVNTISGVTYPAGKVPDTISTFSNSNIRYPKSDLT